MAARKGRQVLAGARYRAVQPQADTKSLAHFVRSMRRQGVFSDSEIAAPLRNDPASALILLSNAGVQRLGERVRFSHKPFDRAELLMRLSGQHVSPACIPALVRSGSLMGLYSASELRHAISGMDAREAQIPTYWWNRLLDVRLAPEHKAVLKEHYLEPDFVSEGDDLYVTFEQDLPIVGIISVPGNDSPESILVRDMMLALVEAFCYAFGMLSPFDTISHSGILDDAILCREIMGGSFTANGLLSFLEEHHGSLEDAADELAGEFVSMMAVDEVGSWARIMAALSTPDHWMLRDRVFPLLTHRPSAFGFTTKAERFENIVALYDYNVSMVDLVRQQHSDTHSETLAVADQMLAAILALKDAPESYTFDHFESMPLMCSIQAWIHVSGEDEASQALNQLSDNVFPAGLEDQRAMDDNYFECILIEKNPSKESAQQVGNFCEKMAVGIELLGELQSAS